MGVFLLSTCERCKKELFRYTACNYCGRKICDDCVKSSQRASKTKKLVICKSCWSDMKRRKQYKNKIGMVEVKAAS